MRSVFMRAVVAVIVFAAFSPLASTAQTPVAATPVPGPGVQVLILVESGDNMMTLNDTGTPVPSELDHRLATITLQPGSGFSTGPVMVSALIYVESGTVSIGTAYGVAQVSVGDGEPVVSANGGTVVCEQGTCGVEPGEAVVLGPDNGFALAGDTVEVHAVGNGAAVIDLSAVTRAGNSMLCWICPTM